MAADDSAHVNVSVGAALVGGIGSLRLSAPGSAVSGSVDVSINLSAAAGGASCTAGMPASAPLGRSHLQGAWCGGTYDRDPTARATFGLYRASHQLIYRRENF